MLPFVLKRLLTGALLLVVISIITFFLLRFGTQDVAQRIAGQSAGPDAVAQITQRYGLDQPLVEQFFTWAGGALTLDFGRSWFTGQLVTDAIATRLPVTISLAVGSVLISAVLGVVLGALSATRRGWLDRGVQLLTVVGQAVPGFLVAVGLVLVFAVQLHLFPATGYTRPGTSVAGWLQSITLPVIALALGAIGGVAQQVRGSMLDVLDKDFVRTLRSRGLPERRVIYKYVLRNAAGPAVSILGLQFVIILGGAIVVEQVFSIPGVGPMALSATTQGDMPVVLGVVLATAAVVVLVNILVGIVQAILNPKVRLS